MSTQQDHRQEASGSTPMNIEAKLDEEGGSSVHKPPFLPEQRVLCSDVNNDKHFYEAVIRRVKYISERNEWSFLVHYLGWNSRWDRWITKSDIVEDNAENRQKHLKPKEAKKRKQPAIESGGGGRKRKSSDANSKRTLQQYASYCELPFTLKTILIDELENITRKGFDNPYLPDPIQNSIPARSVHSLPAKVTVKQTIQHYQKKRGGPNETEEKQQQVKSFCDGLAALFDDALPVVLLYAEERPQYESLKQDGNLRDKRPCAIYGCEFLLRLMVRMPILLQTEPKSEMDVNGPMLADLIVLLQKNRQACFKKSYRIPKYCEYTDAEKRIADETKSEEKVPPGQQQQQQSGQEMES